MNQANPIHISGTGARGVGVYGVILIFFWTAVIGGSLAWNVHQAKKTLRIMTAGAGRISSSQDSLFRGTGGGEMPMAEILAHEQEELNKLILSHLGIFLVGMAGICLGFRKLNTVFRMQEQAEVRQKQTAERLEALLGDLPVGVVIIDHDTRTILDANAHALAILESSLDRIAGKRCTDYICPAQKDNCPVIDQGLHLDHSEREVITRDGQRVPVLKTVIATEIDDRKALLECFIDITDKKRAEKELLENERLQVVLEMAGGVCHEFNQPIQIISGNCELLAGEGNLGKPVEKSLEAIAEAAVRMGRLTGNLMNLTSYKTKPYLDKKIADFAHRDPSAPHDLGDKMP